MFNYKRLFAKYYKTEKKMENVQLSKNFWLSELVKSDTAERNNIDNWPTEQRIVDNLTLVTKHVLQPARDYFKVSIRPNSGFRCLILNRLLKSKDTSQHLKGEAVDFEVPGTSTYDLAVWVRDNLDFDQLILEMFNPEILDSGWVHCSYVSSDRNRKSIITIFSRRSGGGVFNGLHLLRP